MEGGRGKVSPLLEQDNLAGLFHFLPEFSYQSSSAALQPAKIIPICLCSLDLLLGFTASGSPFDNSSWRGDILEQEPGKKWANDQ